MRKPTCNRIFRYFVYYHLTSMGCQIIKDTILWYAPSSSSTTGTAGSSSRSAWCMTLISSSHGSILSKLVLWSGSLLHVSSTLLIRISRYAPTSKTLSDSRRLVNRPRSKSFIKSCSKLLSILFVFLTRKYMTFRYVTKGNNFDKVKLVLLLQVLRQIKLIFKPLVLH